MKRFSKFLRRTFLILSIFFLGLNFRGCIFWDALFSVFNSVITTIPDHNAETAVAIPPIPLTKLYRFAAADSGLIWRYYYIPGIHTPVYEIDYNVPGSPDLFDIRTSHIRTNNIDYYWSFCVGENGTIVKRIDLDEWQEKNSNVNADLNKIDILKQLLYPNVIPIIVGNEGIIIYSLDYGETWLAMNFPYTCNLKDIEIQNDPNIPYNERMITVIGGPYCAYKTTDFGETWEQIAIGLDNLIDGPMHGPNSFNKIFFFDDNVGYIGGPYGLMGKTTDGGTTWELLVAPDFNEITEMHFISPDSGIALGTAGTARLTTDGGNTWFEDDSLTAFLDTVTITNIVPYGRNHGSVIGEGNFSMFVAKDSTYLDSLTNPTGVEDDITLIRDFHLFQNYPNPFNPLTIIEYNLPEYGFVTLKVYDLLGNEIATLVNEEKHAGSYKINFDGSDLASGIYYYQLKVGNEFVETRKMVLLK